jgi:hypothetical protein
VDNNIPAQPNPFLTQWFLSGDCARVLREGGHIMAGLFSAVVAKRSGALAASPQVGEPFIGGEKNDRLELLVISGIGTHGQFGTRPGYGAAHEFGSGIHPQSTGRGIIPQQPVDDWVKVLAIMDSLP